MMLFRPVPVAETSLFIREAERILTANELDALKAYLAWHPDEGDVIPGMGGARKIRWAARGKGKRGGSRVIYFYRNPGFPLVLLMVFAKSEKSDLTADERQELRNLISHFTRKP